VTRIWPCSGQWPKLLIANVHPQNVGHGCACRLEHALIVPWSLSMMSDCSSLCLIIYTTLWPNSTSRYFTELRVSRVLLPTHLQNTLMENYVLTRGCRERDWTFSLFTLNERQEHASNREAQSKRVRDTKKGRESYVKSEPLLWVNLRLIMMLDVQNRSRKERIEAPPCPWVFRLPLVCCIVLWPRHLSQKSTSWEVLRHKCFVKICGNEFSNVLYYEEEEW
jgi:hypothetical protein